jgi:cytochrome P450
MQGVLAPAFGIDLADPALVADPYPAYAALREHRVGWGERLGCWVAADHHSVAQLARTASLVSAGGSRTGDDDERRTLQRAEDGEHERLRTAVVDVFHGEALRRLIPYVAKAANELATHCLAGGEADLMSDFAHPLAMRVIARVLGLPDAELEPLTEWTAVIASGMCTTHRAASGPPTGTVAAAQRHVLDSVARLCETRRRERQDDLVSRLVHDPRLSPGEARAMVRLLLFTGSHPTALAIGNAALTLATHPAQWDALASRPDWLPLTVEECFRFEPVIQAVAREARVELEVAATLIRPGDQVILLYGSANRDEQVFPRADSFDVARSPNPHIAFGRGVHACLAPGLARLELAAALECLLRRGLTIRLSGEPVRLGNPVLRGLARLPVRLERR